MAERHADGAVALAIYAKEVRDAGWPAASGGVAFGLLLDAERADGDVTAILGIWHTSSDNYLAFKRWKDAGLSASEAALRTFTGAEAARHGYGEVAQMEEGGDAVRVRFVRGGQRR